MVVLTKRRVRARHHGFIQQSKVGVGRRTVADPGLWSETPSGRGLATVTKHSVLRFAPLVLALAAQRRGSIDSSYDKRTLLRRSRSIFRCLTRASGFFQPSPGLKRLRRAAQHSLRRWVRRLDRLPSRQAARAGSGPAVRRPRAFGSGSRVRLPASRPLRFRTRELP